VVEKTFAEMAAKHGFFEVVSSQNSRKEITEDNLKHFDAVFFFTTGELPLSEVQKADLLSFIRNGKGFGGSHCAADTFYQWKEYGDLIGAYFAGHPPGFQKIRVIVEDRKHPATKHLGEGFNIEDEIYKYKGPYSREKVRVLLSMDMKASGKNLWREDGDNPLAWVREYGKGRVFYTAFGHREEVWADPRFQQHVIGGLRYLFGLEPADATPSAAATN
jgi:type 1 glutamine amidotransferase